MFELIGTIIALAVAGDSVHRFGECSQAELVLSEALYLSTTVPYEVFVIFRVTEGFIEEVAKNEEREAFDSDSLGHYAEAQVGMINFANRKGYMDHRRLGTYEEIVNGECTVWIGLSLTIRLKLEDLSSPFLGFSEDMVPLGDHLITLASDRVHTAMPDEWIFTRGFDFLVLGGHGPGIDLDPNPTEDELNMAEMEALLGVPSAVGEQPRPNMYEHDDRIFGAYRARWPRVSRRAS